MAKKHARELHIEVEKGKVEMAGKLKGQTRSARQAEAELTRVLAERRELQGDLHRAVQDKNDALRRIGRERRQHDVDVRGWKDKCENLQASVRLREKQDEGKKRQHKVTMEKADVLCTTLKTKLKLLDKREGELRYQHEKARKQLGEEKAAVTILKWGVERGQSVVGRREIANTKRTDTLTKHEATLCQKRQKLQKEKQVMFSSFFQFFIRLLSLFIAHLFVIPLRP